MDLFIGIIAVLYRDSKSVSLEYTGAYFNYQKVVHPLKSKFPNPKTLNSEYPVLATQLTAKQLL
jgi:hypothetical protein